MIFKDFSVRQSWVKRNLCITHALSDRLKMMMIRYTNGFCYSQYAEKFVKSFMHFIAKIIFIIISSFEQFVLNSGNILEKMKKHLETALSLLDLQEFCVM